MLGRLRESKQCAAGADESTAAYSTCVSAADVGVGKSKLQVSVIWSESKEEAAVCPIAEEGQRCK